VKLGKWVKSLLKYVAISLVSLQVALKEPMASLPFALAWPGVLHTLWIRLFAVTLLFGFRGGCNCLRVFFVWFVVAYSSDPLFWSTLLFDFRGLLFTEGNFVGAAIECSSDPNVGIPCCRTFVGAGNQH